MTVLFEGWVTDPEGVDITRDRVAKAARKSAKVGMPVPTVVVTDQTREEVKASEDERLHLTALGLPLPTVTLRLIRIEAEGDLRLGGWRFIAVNEPVSGAEALVMRVPGYEGDIPEEFRAANPDRCDHCNKKRVRNQSFVIVNEQGEYKQVGRNCLADFLGHDPRALVATLALWDDLSKNEEGLGASGTAFWTFADVVGVAARTASAFGYVSRRKAEEMGEQATADIVADLLFGMSPTKVFDGADRERFLAVSADRVATLVADTTAALAESKGDNEWEYNVSLLARADRVPVRRVGLAASSVILGWRRAEKREAAQSAPESVYVGTVGQPFQTVATVTFLRSFVGNYGPTTIVRLRADGADLLWFASRDPQVEVGQTVVIRGTVKAHEQDKYTGKATTVLTRANILSRAA
jgi:hypothetical protein